MKKKLTLACIVMLITETICLFIPYCFVNEVWEYEESIVYHGVSSLEREDPVNIFGVYTMVGKLLAIILIISLLVAILGFIMSYLKKQKENNKIINFMPLISLVLLIIFAIYAINAERDNIYYRHEWNVYWLFYIIMALQVLSCVFGLLIQFEKQEAHKMVPAKIEQSDITENIKSGAEKIKQYKELFDSGIITEEEFEEKKKQILEL